MKLCFTLVLQKSIEPTFKAFMLYKRKPEVLRTMEYKWQI